MESTQSGSTPVLDPELVAAVQQSAQRGVRRVAHRTSMPMSCLVESQLPRLPQSTSLEGYAEYPVEYAEYPVAYVEGRTARNPSNQRADHAAVLAVLSPVTKGNFHLRQSHWCDNSQ